MAVLNKRLDELANEIIKLGENKDGLKHSLEFYQNIKDNKMKNDVQRKTGFKKKERKKRKT